MENTSQLNVYAVEFDKVEKIGKMCNNYINKNGYKRMEMKHVKNIDENKLLEYMHYLLKLYFSLVVSFDGKNSSSSDYMDYLEIGCNPPENYQHLVAPNVLRFYKKRNFRRQKLIRRKKILICL